MVRELGGDVRCVYGEELDLRELGKLQITRASHVEPDRDGFWWADTGPVDGPVLGPFKNRTEALGAEGAKKGGQKGDAALFRERYRHGCINVCTCVHSLAGDFRSRSSA